MTLYQEKKTKIYKHIYFRIWGENKEARVEEMVQECFIKLWKVMQIYKIDNLNAYLYKIANNIIIDWSRSKRGKESSLDELMENEDGGHYGWEPSIDINYDFVLAKEELERIMNKLPIHYQNMLKLRYLKDWSPVEIGRYYGMTANHVSVMINRAVKKARIILQNDKLAKKVIAQTSMENYGIWNYGVL